MKIFITGATGFIGKHLVNKLIEDGNEVTINLYGDEQSFFNGNVKTHQLGTNDIIK